MPLAYRLMLEDGGYDSLVVFQSAAGLSARGPELVQQAVEMRAKYPDRVIAVCSLFTPELHQEARRGAGAGIRRSQAARCARLLRWRPMQRTRRPAAKAAALPKVELPRGTLSEAGALASLKAAGIPVMPHRVATNAGDAVAAAEEFGFPVVAKIVSPDILHKTEIGGVALNLQTQRAGGESVR